ncbi:DUF3453 domain-containing protein [Paenibacillus aceris]|uniref:Uncharacterized protein n=1 Tax=Paenibacillus aceris TaxID=869555 RepID=A0ABS4HUG8_9BACL|nr:DUF3453 domain-containing protein [Paenibacillus aceris]MBP1962165.1 hypothetical protein [Paenibacillus aceris]NHW33987.1 DUF3453 domain-containing protein [Paenibacillus aceris]
MTEKEIDTQTEENSAQDLEQEQAQIIMTWFQHINEVMKTQFPEYEVEGQIGNNPTYGPMFAFTLKKDEKFTSCGFFLNEIMRNFQTNPNAGLWLSSFFVDLLRSPDNHPLPNPPQTEDEAKELLDKHIVPYCASAVREEFPDQKIYVDLELHEEHGPVLEAGFVAVQEGNNTCALPLQYLMTLYLLNRDPAEPLNQAMYRLYEENNLGQS